MRSISEKPDWLVALASSTEKSAHSGHQTAPYQVTVTRSAVVASFPAAAAAIASSESITTRNMSDPEAGCNDLMTVMTLLLVELIRCWNQGTNYYAHAAHAHGV